MTTGEAASTCGCGTDRKATGVDAELKHANLTRLRRIEGQVRGLQRMVEEDRYCADILAQVASVHEALRGVAGNLMRNHLRHCASAAFREGGDAADDMLDELVDLMHRYPR